MLLFTLCWAHSTLFNPEGFVQFRKIFLYFSYNPVFSFYLISVFSFFELVLVRHGTIWLHFPTLSYFLFLSLLALALRTLFLICLQFLITICISWNCICGNSPGPGLMMSSSGEKCIASRLVLGGTINLKLI